jgi:hypothetical protein
VSRLVVDYLDQRLPGNAVRSSWEDERTNLG